jgi:hypothetical protein
MAEIAEEQYQLCRCLTSNASASAVAWYGAGYFVTLGLLAFQLASKGVVTGYNGLQNAVFNFWRSL